MENGFVSLDCLSIRMELPKSYLRQLAAANKIPFVIVGGNRKRFNQEDVCLAIRQMAQQKSSGGEVDANNGR